MSKTVTLNTSRGAIDLPLEGAKFLAFGLGQGIPDLTHGALGALGFGEEGAQYASKCRRMAAKLNAIGGHVKSVLIDGEETPAADVVEIEAIGAELTAAWAPIQAIIDAAREAVEATGYDGAPC